MNSRNEENLKDLFEKFLNSKQTEEAVEDVYEAEQILSKHPAPEPDKELIADIKVEIAKTLRRRRADVFRRTAYKAAVAAAVVIVLSAIGVKLFEKGESESERVITASIIPNSVWESDDIATDDADLAILTAEIEEIEDEMLALQLGENGSNGNYNLLELEIELIEIDSDFWKG